MIKTSKRVGVLSKGLLRTQSEVHLVQAYVLDVSCVQGLVAAAQPGVQVTGCGRARVVNRMVSLLSLSVM